MRGLVVLLALTPCWPACAASTQPVTADTVESLLREDAQPLEGAFRVAVPQAELRVTLDGFPLVPAMGLTTWVELTPGPEAPGAPPADATARGEVVALEDEAGALERAALGAGFAVDGVEDHFLRETPRVVFLEISARGRLDELQDRARRLFAAITEERKGRGLQDGPTRAPGSLDAVALSKALGARPRLVDGVAQARLAGSEVLIEGTMEKAAAAARLRVPQDAVAAAERSLLGAGFELASARVTPAGAQLRVWSTGPAMTLARALRAALDSR